MVNGPHLHKYFSHGYSIYTLNVTFPLEANKGSLRCDWGIQELIHPPKAEKQHLYLRGTAVQTSIQVLRWFMKYLFILQWFQRVSNKVTLGWENERRHVVRPQMIQVFKVESYSLGTKQSLGQVGKVD